MDGFTYPMKLKWLLPILFLFCSSAKGAVLPAGTSFNGECNSYLNTAGTGVPIECDMPNVASGELLLVYVNLVSSTTFTVSATETLSCPSQLLIAHNFSGFVHNNFICTLIVASSHADFNITVTNTNQGSGGRQAIMHVERYLGFGALDTGSRATGDLSSSINYTTANANETTFCFNTDLADQITPSGSNNYHDMLVSADNGTSAYRALFMVQNTGVAGTYTCSATSTTSSNVNFTVAVSFQVSGGSPPGSVYADEHYHFLYADAGSNTKPAYFYNVSSGQKGVVNYHIQDNAAATCVSDSGETCTCDAGTVVTISPDNNYTQGICRIDFTSTHSGYVTMTISPSTSAASFDFISAYLMNGLTAGADTASAAAASGTSVGYNTLAANEWTMCFGTSVKATYPMVLNSPTGSPATALNNGYSDAHNLRYTEGVDMFAKNVSSGAQTCSFSNSNLNPLISTISYSAPSTGGALRRKGWIGE